MQFQDQSTVLALELDCHVADRDIVLPFKTLAIRKWKPRGEPGVQWIANVDGVKVAQGTCVDPRQSPQTETFYPDLALLIPAGAKLRFQFSKENAQPAITIGLECTASFE